MTRKNAIITLIVILLIALGVILYLTFFIGEEENPLTPKNNGSEVINTFFPSSNDINNTNNQNVPQNNFQVNIPKLRQLSNVPVSGFVSFEREVETTSILINEETGEEEEETNIDTETIFRYVERSSGNIFETTARDLSIKRITNTTIPKIYNALFTSDGEGVVLQYLDPGKSIETFVANIVFEEEEEIIKKEVGDEITLEVVEEEVAPVLDNRIGKLEGVFLPKHINSITKSPESDSFFYTVSREGKTYGYIFDFETPEDGNLILQSDILQLTSDWYKDNRINIYTKPTQYLEGLSFSLNTDTKNLTKIFGNRTGLETKVNPDGTQILYSASNSEVLETGVYNSETNIETNLNINILAEKCVWKDSVSLYCATPKSAVKGNILDSWYQGLISFNDEIAHINLMENIVILLDGLGDNNFDIINPQLSEDGDYYIFMNKKDLTLWSLDLHS